MGLFECFSSHGVWKDKRRGSGCGGRREIPDDLIIDILSRLPAECVIKYRRVCRRWLALTCTPHFAQLHLKRSATATTTTLLLQMRCCRRVDDKLNLFQLGENNTKRKKDNNSPPTLKRIIHRDVVIAERLSDLRLRASCDGLLVFQDAVSTSRFVVCNILTREQVIVDPPINNPSCDSSVHAMFLHPVTKEYMMLFQNTVQGTLPYVIRNEFYLFGFTSELWRKISSFHHIPKHVFHPVLLNNTLHWMTSRSVSFEYNSHYIYSPPCESAIFTFDTITEEIRVMPHPGNTCAPPHLHQFSMFIYEAQGTLCLFWIQPSGGVADIWALEDYDNWCWAKKKTIVNAYIDQMGPTRLIFNQELVYQSGTRFYKVNIDKNQQQPEILVHETRKEFKRKIIDHPVVVFPITKSFVSLNPSKDDEIQLSIHPSPEEN